MIILSWICSGLILLGFYLNVKKKLVPALLIWIIADIGWIFYNLNIKNYAPLTLSIIITLINIYGLIMQSLRNKLILSNENLPLSIEEREGRINAASFHYGEFLTAMGFNWKDDPNMQDTPNRVAKAYINELYSGCFSSPPKITTFENNGQYDGVVFQGKISLKSTCSHHGLAFIGYAHVAYIPGKTVIGLSKLNRIVDWFARRPQIQEGLTMQIHNYLHEICTGNGGVAVLLEANHTCASCRGIQHDSTMKTAKLSGAFKDNPESRQEFYEFVRNLK